jgi:hypothetical protein
VSLKITDTLQIEVKAETQVEAERIAVKKASRLNWSEYKKRLLRSTGFEVTETNKK